MDLDSVVKPEMTQEWEEAKKEWFPRIDSKSNAAYDLRTPGNRAIQLLKVIFILLKWTNIVLIGDIVFSLLHRILFQVYSRWNGKVMGLSAWLPKPITASITSLPTRINIVQRVSIDISA